MATIRNVLFVLHNDFKCNSAVHVHNFANHLAELGLACAVAVPFGKETVEALSEHRYTPLLFKEIGRLRQVFGDGRGPDVVHAWTPREVVRKFVAQLAPYRPFKLLVDLEDNEELLTEQFRQKSLSAIEADDANFPDDLSHPRRYRELLATCDGVTLIIDQLGEFVPPGVPTLTLWPGTETRLFYPRRRDDVLARSIGVPLNTAVLTYTGNVHVANAREVRSLYLAVALLNRDGFPTVLVRAGRDYYPFLGEIDTWAKKYVIDLGYVQNHQIPQLLALADVLVQPGRPDRFNNYRFPSKLPEFLAMGRPVVLPATNVGSFTEHLRHAYVLPVADAMQIAAAVRHIMGNPALYQTLAEGATTFARDYLNWQENSKKLLSFYREV
jgi:glycosyltransferase involved in cell wall biosynthesis